MLRSYFLPQAGNARSVSIAALLLCLSTFLPSAVGQAKDPGPRAGAAGAGSFFATLNATEQQTFLQAAARSTELLKKFVGTCRKASTTKDTKEHEGEIGFPL